MASDQAYAEGYSGVTFRIKVNPGTSAQLENIALSANKGTTRVFPHLVERTGPWTKTNARFKLEGEQITTQLGKGSALRIFNENLLQLEVVRPYATLQR